MGMEPVEASIGASIAYAEVLRLQWSSKALIAMGSGSVDMDESKRKGVFVAASPLQPTATATTIRKENGRPLVLDGPFAETKEQLAGYYILDCANLDEAIAWAAKVPTACRGGEGCIEIRPIADIPPR